MKKSFKALYRTRYLLLLLVPILVAMVAISTMGMKVPSARDKTPEMSILYGPTVGLGTTESFAVLAATPKITDAGGATKITGDVGLSPAAGTGIELLTTQVTGTIYAVDSSGPAGVAGNNPDLLTQAKLDLGTAYDDAAGRTPFTTIAGGLLGGLTLTSGVYRVPAATPNLTGTLTLDAQGDPNAVFIFQSPSDLITASGSVVSLINGARFCRVFWQVTSSATLGSGSTFVGHIFALTSITVNSGVTVYGQLLARNGTVTLDHDTITNGSCGTIAYSGGILTIYKVDSSGNPIVASTPAMAAAFKIYANTADIGVNPPVQEGSIIKDTNFFRTNLQNGTYYVVETSAPEGYSRDSTVRTVTVSSGDAAVTFVNGQTVATTTTTEAAAVETTAAATTTAPPVTVTTTVTGGKLPKTGTPWYNLLFAGIILILIGAIVWISRKVYGKRSKI